ncbi:MAG TPA: SDR family oxidoreductase [Bryobacteraceae bacterium]|nr:SDR family oxidoreductase [Bryobacteraceae bacterium]
MANCFDLSGHVAVVTGGTSGIGRALALGLAAHGASVAPAGRRRHLVEEVCGAIEAAGGAALAHTVDVRARHSLEALREAVLDRFGGVDILVNAAGYTFKQPTAQMAEEQWLCLMDTNLTGALRACQVFYEPLKRSGRGRVINVASLSSFLAFHEVAAYSASKTGLLSLTRSLACEWARDGICVNALAPGIFPTEMNRELVMGTARGRELLMRTPMGRFGDPAELVGVAVLLASAAASFLTGQCIAVDGGYLASGVNS